MTPLLDFERALAVLAPGYGKPNSIGSMQTLAEFYVALEARNHGSPADEPVRSAAMASTHNTDGQ